MTEDTNLGEELAVNESDVSITEEPTKLPVEDLESSEEVL